MSLFAKRCSDLWVAVAMMVATACAAPDLGGVAEVPDGLTEAVLEVPGATGSWSAEAQAGIAAGEYAPQPDGEGFRITNRAQNLRAGFGEHGVAITNRAGTGEVLIELTGWGREGASDEAAPAFPEEGPCLAEGTVDAFGECLHRVDYARPGLTEWWENRSEGLEFGYSVTAPPDGDGALVFELALRGALADVDGDDVLLVREVGEPLRLAKLAAWDERGRELPAWMEETEDGLRIVVDDEGATGVVTVDPLITTNSWTAEGDQAESAYGYSATSAGDVNGDGYGDVVVGARLYDNGSSNEGRAFVYMGSSSGLASSASWTAESDQAGALFGCSVATAGDVNGDGYADVVIGADGYDNGSTDEGRVYVYLGSSSGLATSSAWTAESDQTTAEFGFSVSTAGDVNGDGYADIVVGAYQYDNGQTNEGRAYAYLGSASGLATSAAWTAESDQASAYFAEAVASAGDVNGDGYGDVVVGDYAYDNGSANEGRAYVYLGSAAGLATSAAWTAESDQASAYFGKSVSSAGDVNGDGYGDLVVSAYEYDNGSTDEGRAYVYLGSSSGLASSAAWAVESNQTSAEFGGRVSAAGDVNGDGYGDVIVGAYAYDNGSTNEGHAWVYLGSSGGLDTVAAWEAESDQASAYFGISVAGAGDVNGDGYGDVIVGAFEYDNGESNEGRAYVYLGSASGLGTSSAWSAESDQSSSDFGGSVSSAGDVNGDGYGDVVVGADGYDNGQTNEGRAYVYLGSSSGLATSASWTVESDQASASFGESVASAGDVNGDGYGDVVVGACEYDNGSTDEGRAYVYLGSSAGLATSAAWTAESDQASACFGSSVASAGDVNGDGYGDVVVGATGYDNGESAEGRAYVYLGSSSGLTTSASWTAESDRGTALFGGSVASAGDVNGDGYNDVVVGAEGWANGETYEGRAYVYLGQASGLATAAAWTAESDAYSAWFGKSVASAGDVNGDGYGDLAVGAHYYSNGQTEEGRSYVYLGSSAGLATVAAWTAESDQASAQFGYSVASAGDVNGDGYGDVLVGAQYYDNGSTNEGRTYLYLGSGSGLAASAAWTAESGRTSAAFGRSVASAGDVNGDGYGDIVVGAVSYSNGQAYEGAAFVYYGGASDGTTPLSLTPQARQPSSTTPLSPGLSSTSSSSFDAAMLSARTPFGVGKIKVQVEAKPLGTAFDGTSLQTQTSYTSSGLTGASVTQAITGLTGSTGYHWRARVFYSPAEGRPQGWGPWVYGGLSGNAVGGHVFTLGTTYYADADGDGYGDASSSTVSRASSLSGYVTTATDCDDTSATISPAGTEITADSIDQDCDNVDSCYTDADNDNYGTTVVTDGSSLSCATGTGAAVSTDCDDSSSTINPAATEITADSIDQDCDSVDSCYTDADNDNYGTTVVVDGSSLSCATGTGSTVSTDCDDTSATVYPSASETTADSIDQDCDNVDSCYTDADGDNYGTTVVVDGSSLSCTTGTGAAVSTDCDDTSTTVYPGASETTADGIDQDCDAVDSCYTDADNDGYGTTVVTDGSSLSCATGTGATVSTDCDDTSALVYPGASETTADSIDQDCDSVDSCYTDADNDNYGTTIVTDGSSLSCSTGTGAPVSSDCNDASATVYPGATETTADSIDQDCDNVDSCYTDADGDNYGTSVVIDGSSLSCSTGTGATVSTDCDDTSALISPAASETTADSTDQDCDNVDSCYTDADNDNYGTTVVIDGSSLSCTTGTGAPVSTDCDDASATVYPGATETTADGIDQDCDNVDSCYTDADGDNYGTSVVIDGSSLSCATGTGAAVSTDCNDTSVSINPAATETTADGIDQDCDNVDSCYTDADGDNYGTAVPTDGSSLSCATGSGAANTTDCDDTSASINPAATEIAGDAVDQNCDGAESCYTDTDYDGARTAFVVASPDVACSAPGEALSTADLDCDDTDATSYPDAAEITGSGVDEDCDGTEVCYADADTDGYRPDSTSTVSSTDADCSDSGEALATALTGDCNDASTAYNPGVAETDCTDPEDYNCDGASGYTDADGDGYAACDECDDGDASVHAGGTETPGDGVDGDCDGVDTCYVDADGDGYRTSGTVAGTTIACDGAGEASVDAGVDCDDADATINPASPETVGDEVDADCDGTESCYADADLDGYRADDGAVSESSDADCTDAGEALSSAGADCDDTDAAVNPTASEVAGDGTDSDCDASELCYADADDDGYRADSGATVASTDVTCSGAGEAPSTAPTGDCDDSDALVNPAGTENPGDEVDGDCDGTELCYADLDDDGYRGDDGATVASADTDCSDATEALVTTLTGDCNDADAAYNPAVAETDCTDPADYNCDGSTGYDDSDADGWVACMECDDIDAAVNPDATELPGDAVDQNCDGAETCFVDADDDGYRPDETSTAESANVSCDGAGEAVVSDASNDCDDADAAVNPGATELPGDEVDQDCDGTEFCFADADEDGYAADGDVVVESANLRCDGTGEAAAGTPAGDCNDASAAYNPAAIESDCTDPEDYNCDGSSGAYDGDGDLYGACEECDDGNAAVNPAAPEVCNGFDDDCDGTIDINAIDAQTWYADADRDGYVDLDDAVTACDPPPGYIAATEQDCDDLDAPSHPGGDDVPGDGLDQDCDGADASNGVVDDTGSGEPAKDGCGCQVGSAYAAWAMVVAGMAVVTRRRRAA